jgi:hypothetical protein
MRPLTDGSKLARAAAIGDVVALLLFLVVGLDRHAENDAARFAALAAIFLGCWLAIAWFVGTYRPPTNGKLAVTLALGIPLAVAVRAALVSAWTTTEVLTFMAVALLLCASFVGAVRAAVLLAFRWRAST